MTPLPYGNPVNVERQAYIAKTEGVLEELRYGHSLLSARIKKLEGIVEHEKRILRADQP